MRVTPRRVLWVVVVTAFVLTIKDDIVSVVQNENYGPPIAKKEMSNTDGAPDVPVASLQAQQAAPAAAEEPAVPLSPEEQEIHDWEELQASRKGNLVQICKEVREHADVDFPPPDVLFKYMVVDHVHKVIHCPYQGPEKTNSYKKALSWVASSSLRVKQKSENYLGDVSEAPPPSFLQELAQQSAANATAAGNASEAMSARDLEFGRNYTAEQMDYMLQHYVKVMFPDHPYERLLAVFDRKFTNRTDEIGTTLGRSIVKMNRPSAKWKEVTDSEIYYHEYMDFVLKKKGTIPDFMIYYDMCHVCDMPWDYIGKSDTYERDATHLMKAIEGEEAATHNGTSDDLVKLEDSEVQEHMMTNYKNITEWKMLRLYDDFSLDMYLFDFPWPFFNLTLMRDDPTKDGKYA